MLKLITPLLLIVLTGLLTACSSPVILPLKNGEYQVIADGLNKTDALTQAKQKAQEQCHSEHKRLVVDHCYSLMNNDIKTAQKNGSVSQATLSMLNPDNSQIVLNFHCIR